MTEPGARRRGSAAQSGLLRGIRPRWLGRLCAVGFGPGQEWVRAALFPRRAVEGAREQQPPLPPTDTPVLARARERAWKPRAAFGRLGLSAKFLTSQSLRAGVEQGSRPVMR